MNDNKVKSRVYCNILITEQTLQIFKTTEFSPQNVVKASHRASNLELVKRVQLLRGAETKTVVAQLPYFSSISLTSCPLDHETNTIRPIRMRLTRLQSLFKMLCQNPFLKTESKQNTEYYCCIKYMLQLGLHLHYCKNIRMTVEITFNAIIREQGCPSSYKAPALA